MTIIVRCGDGLIGYFLPKEGLRSRQSRRALFAADEARDLGDTSTLADPTVVDDLVGNRQNRAAG